MKKLLSLFLSAALCFCTASQVWEACDDPSCIVNGNPPTQESQENEDGNNGQGQGENEIVPYNEGNPGGAVDH